MCQASTITFKMLPLQRIQPITTLITVPLSMYTHIKHTVGVSEKIIIFCISVLLRCTFKHLHIPSGDPT